MEYTNKVGFAIGSGRCGTLFLHKLVDMEPKVASSHERNPYNETFHRYCKWNGLPVDDEGFLTTKENEIVADLKNHSFSFEASPYLSFSAKELHERFGARFLFLVRRPDRVVTSFLFKGFYPQPYRVKNTDHATGYQVQGKNAFFTFLARISPHGDYFNEWNSLTRVGKIAWFWKVMNQHTFELLSELPEESYRIVRIEEFDYEKYLELANFLGFQSTTSQIDFDNLRESRPHAFWRKENLDQWSHQEIAEFENQVGEQAEQLGYEYRVANLLDEILAEKAEVERRGHIPQKKKGPQFWRFRRSTADLLRGLAKGIDVI